MNGMPRFNVRDQSAGFVGERIMRPESDGLKDGKPLPDDLLVSTDKNFRPVDAQIGPDGALWFGDWCNALIGHMQYSQRDPNRDHFRGRIYRLVYTKNKLLEPVTQYGKTEAELLDQLREYEPRTRYRARRELRDRPKDVALAAVAKWTAALDPNDSDYDRLRCEALWAQQSQHAVEQAILKAVLTANTSNARAAAVHVVSDERDYLPNALELLEAAVGDENPRVRLEAVRGLSFFQSPGAFTAAISVLNLPTDPWIDYTLEHTIAALEPQWRDAYQANKLDLKNDRATAFLTAYVNRRAPGVLAQAQLKKLISPDTNEHGRAKAYAALEAMPGDAANGRSVFSRLCVSCHKVGTTGYTFGPDLSDVGKRLKRHEILESILEPSKKVDPKYITTTIVTDDGKTSVGFIMEKTKDSLTLRMAEGKQRTIPLDEIDQQVETNQSSMPENLVSALSPAEFLDIIEYLATRK
jgi:putative heme-binding domain-containing protein